MNLRTASRDAVRDGAVIAIAMVVMNVTTYGFTILAARLLGPVEYGALAAVMGLLLVVNVLSLGLQATGARRVSAAPQDRLGIEHEVMATSYASSLVLGAVLLVASPFVAAGAEPRLVGVGRPDRDDRRPAVGDGRAGRDPAGRAPLGTARDGLPRGRRRPPRLRPGGPAGPHGHARRHGRHLGGGAAAGADRRVGPAPPGSRTCDAGPREGADADGAALGQGRRAARDVPQLPRAAGVLRAVQRRRDHRPDHPRRAPGRALRRRPDPHQGGAVPAAVRGGDRVPVDVAGRATTVVPTWSA